MKIVMIIGQDTNNFTLSYIVKVMLNRGHNVDIYGAFLNKNHLYMFDDINITIKHIDNLTKEMLEYYDAAFVSVKFFFDMPWMLDAKVYMMAFDTLYLDEPCLGVDLMFERGSGWRPELPAGHRMESARIVVGDPKHDYLQCENVKEKDNRFLFIDSGHYPFGLEGKRKAAEFLLEVCRRFPEYELVVKPRFLKGDKDVTHMNSMFLYDILEEMTQGALPSNLVLLHEHKRLESLIAGAHTVICMYTTAYIDAAIQDKGLIILDNLPNEEDAVLRIKTHWNVARQIMSSSGCLVDYREAIQYLPDGLKCSEAHLRQQIYSIGNSSENIVKCIEYIWSNYLSKSRYPALGEYYYDKLEDTMCSDEELTIERLIELRKKNYLFWWERVFYKNTTFFPSDNKVTRFIEELDSNGILKNASREELINMVSSKLLEYANEVPCDEISQSYLFAQMMYGDNIRKIFDVKPERVACTNFYYFILGRAYYADKKYIEASETFEKFFGTLSEDGHMTGLGSAEGNILSAYYYCGMSYMKADKLLKAKECFVKCQELTDNNHHKAQEQLDYLKDVMV